MKAFQKQQAVAQRQTLDDALLSRICCWPTEHCHLEVRVRWPEWVQVQGDRQCQHTSPPSVHTPVFTTAREFHSIPLLNLRHAPWAGSTCTLGRIHWARSTSTVGRIHLHRGQDPHAPWAGSTCTVGRIHIHRGQDPLAPWAGSTCTVGRIHLHHGQDPLAPWAGSKCTMGRIHSQ